jgi:hypothetical protein
MTPESDAVIEKVDGRSREARAARAPHRPVARTNPRIAPREVSRAPSRKEAVVVGRDGQPLTRKRNSVNDPFHIPDNIVPKGWSYQWNVVSVIGNSDVVLSQNMAMYENGWRPVPAERHPGLFVPVGKTGDVVRDGQRLEERPMALTQEARAEDVMIAKRQIADRNESLKLAGVKNQMPDGFSMGGKYRGTGGDIRMSIDRALDIPTPQHELAERGE